MTLDSLDSKEQGWAASAACVGVDPEIFFPPPNVVATKAKKICLSCNVRQECLEFALANGEHFGIWGGTSERERQRLRVKLGYSVSTHQVRNNQQRTTTQEMQNND